MLTFILNSLVIVKDYVLIVNIELPGIPAYLYILTQTPEK